MIQNIRRWQPYPAYKPSGVPWLGSIPAHWEVRRLKQIITCLDGKRIPLNSEQRGTMQGEYPYWGANSIVDYVDRWLFDEELVLLGEDGAPFFAENKQVAFFVNGKIWVNNHAHVLRPDKEINPIFLAHVLNIVEYRVFIDGSTRDKLTQSDMSAIPIQVPPLPEQRAIAAFLDRETARLDTLIAKKEQLIERLQEKRTALISRAVTKGLDANASMKDSGVEWLGEIPEGWDIKPLGNVARLQRGFDLTVQQRRDGQIPVVTSSGLSGFHDRAMVKGPGVATGRYGTIGEIYFVEQDFWPMNTALYVSNFNGNYPRYIFYLLKLLPFDMFSGKSAVPGVDRKDLHTLYVTEPPRDEQRAIAEYLDHATARLDALVTKIQDAITRLREYRGALIAAAVTGKVDVRDTA